jgi:serine/threonine protein kinase
MLNSEAASGTAAAPVGRVASFGKYLLLQRVSVGGMAEIFKAIPEGAQRIDQIVAIKRILPNIAEDREFIGMFIDEARIAGQLTHPNICRIYELGRVGADHYIAMQFLWGRDLLKVMNRYKRAGLLIPPPMAVFIAAHAAGALHYAHNKVDSSGTPLHIIHRDVSPQNIIVGYSGQTKLIDFGVARAASQSQKTQAGILKGKFGYMSPEMIRGLPVDHRSDVFAMGICLHEALTGSRLFYGETDFATLELVRDAKIVPPSAKVPGLPPELDAIVLKALSRDAELRYQTANELAEALEVFLETHYPGYGEAEVSASMREAFAHELAREKLRLDAFTEMLERGELVRGAALPSLPADAPPSGERSALPSDAPPASQPVPADASLGSPLPESEPAANGEDAELTEEQTQIFFSHDELSELRQLEQPPEAAWRPPATSDVIMRPSTGLTAPPPMPAPSFATLTPSGTYPRRADETARSFPTEPLDGHRRNEAGMRTQTLQSYDPGNDELAANRADRRRGTIRSSLLAVAALALAALGYSAVSLGAQRSATLQVGAVADGDADALVRVDGVVRGNPPVLVEGLAPGVHSVEVEAAGYEVARSDVSVEAGGNHAIKLVLSRRPARQLDIAQQATVAEVPGSALPPAQHPVPPLKPLGRPVWRPRSDLGLAGGAEGAAPTAAPGTASAEAEPEGTAATGEPVEEVAPAAPPTSSGETQTSESINAEAAAAGEGELLISTVPWSRVIIDGNDTGRDTPVRALRVPAGDHVIVLRTPEGAEHSVSVSVVPGKTVRIIRRF